MSIKITREGTGLEDLGQYLGSVRKLDKVLGRIGKFLSSSTKLRFNQSEDPDGRGWKPSKRVLKQGKGRTLVLTGRLQKSISYASDSNEVNVGTDVEYAAKHNEGLEGLPKRQFLGISDEDRVEIEAIVKDHIEKGGK